MQYWSHSLPRKLAVNFFSWKKSQIVYFFSFTNHSADSHGATSIISRFDLVLNTC